MMSKTKKLTDSRSTSPLMLPEIRAPYPPVAAVPAPVSIQTPQADNLLREFRRLDAEFLVSGTPRSAELEDYINKTALILNLHVESFPILAGELPALPSEAVVFAGIHAEITGFLNPVTPPAPAVAAAFHGSSASAAPPSPVLEGSPTPTE